MRWPRLRRRDVPQAPSPAPVRRPGPMRVVAVSRILDEADIVEAFVRHTAAFAGHHVFLDNGSRDGTMEILQALAAEGFGITVFQVDAVSFDEQAFNTYLFRHAASALEADWVLCLDADEFIDDRGVAGGLTAALAAMLAQDVPCLTVPLVNYEASLDDDAGEGIVPRRMRRRGEVSAHGKVFVQGRVAGAEIGDGNHFAAVGGARLLASPVPGLRLAHYPHRSPYQRAGKCVKGWAKVLASGQAVVARGTNRHYRGLFEIVRDKPQDYFRRGRFMNLRDNAALAIDPIDYRGGPLRHSGRTDEAMRAVRSMTGYLEELALRHGRLIEECPEARARIEAWNRAITRIL